MLGFLIISRDVWQENIILQFSNMSLLLIEIEISDQSGSDEYNNSFCRHQEGKDTGQKNGLRSDCNGHRLPD